MKTRILLFIAMLWGVLAGSVLQSCAGPNAVSDGEAMTSISVSASYKVEFKDAQEAFESAIAAGTLSAAQDAANYAGLYMYMGTWNGVDQFKNVDTRRYL